MTAYCYVIIDYTVGFLFKYTRWIYFMLLQLINSRIHICHFTSHNPDYLDINVLFCFVNTVLHSPGAGQQLLTLAIQLAYT
jgi:hypothetical protein